MSNISRNGKRISREEKGQHRIPNLGYYIIVTDTDETERNYLLGLKQSIPLQLQNRLVIKVNKTETKNLVDEALNMASLYPQFGEIWIVFDRDQVPNFNEIIEKAQTRGIKVGWSNPCIEEWFYAYFGTMPSCLDSVLCCKGFASMFKQRTGQNYSKSDPSIYDKLNRFGDEKKAIEIAHNKYMQQKEIHNGNPAKMCPCTTMQFLIREIKSKINK